MGGLKTITVLGILLLLLVFALDYVPVLVSNSKPASTSMSLRISSDGGKITVYVPVLTEDKGNVIEMFEKPEIKGSATTSLIDTEKGKVLKILGAGNIEINMLQTGENLLQNPQGNEKFINGFTLSTCNATRFGNLNHADAWVYSEENGTVLAISISRDSGWGRKTLISTEQDVKLKEGWQIIGLSAGNLQYD